MIALPERIFFTGVPGSKWSGISQFLEQLQGINTSDLDSTRMYEHHSYTGHRGAYFGSEMEFESILDEDYINTAWASPGGCKIVKSHDWAYKLDEIREKFPNDWIMLVYRPDLPSYAWWHEAGGFQIKYPNYSWYKNHTTVLVEIAKQNDCIMKFAKKHDAQWNHFTAQWIQKTFDQTVEADNDWYDILVAIIK